MPEGVVGPDGCVGDVLVPPPVACTPQAVGSSSKIASERAATQVNHARFRIPRNAHGSRAPKTAPVARQPSNGVMADEEAEIPVVTVTVALPVAPFAIGTVAGFTAQEAF